MGFRFVPAARVRVPVVLNAGLACRFALATVFVAAALPKLARRREFELAIRGYRLVSPASAKRLAAVLPPIELAGGLLLAMGLGTRFVAAALGVCLVVFSCAVVVNLLRGRRIDCGCFGSTVESRISWWTVARNLLLLAAAMAVVENSVRALALDDLLVSNGHALGFVGGFAFVVIGTLAVLAASLVREALRLHAIVREVPR